MGAVEFFIDESVVKANRGGIRGHASVKYPRRACPVNRAEAHRTWVASGVKIATSKWKIAQLVAGCADRLHLGVGGRIVCGGDAIAAFRDYLAVFHYNRGKRSTDAGADVFHPQSDRAAHEFLYHQGFFPFQGALTFGKYQYQCAVSLHSQNGANLQWRGAYKNTKNIWFVPPPHPNKSIASP